MSITNDILEEINGTKDLKIKEAVVKIEKDVWDEMEKDELVRTVTALVGCVSRLEDKVDEIERHLQSETPPIPGAMIP